MFILKANIKSRRTVVTLMQSLHPDRHVHNKRLMPALYSYRRQTNHLSCRILVSGFSGVIVPWLTGRFFKDGQPVIISPLKLSLTGTKASVGIHLFMTAPMMK